jgi:hypothetical protein
MQRIKLNALGFAKYLLIVAATAFLAGATSVAISYWQLKAMRP